MEKKGVLLLFLSNYREQQKRQYTVEGSEESFFGEQTNDAPVKYLLTYAARTGAAIWKILCIASNTVRLKRNGEEPSDFERFKCMVKSYVQENPELREIYKDIPEGMPDVISVDYNEENLDTSLRARDVYKQVAENLSDETDFFVDYTGGFRDISFLMTTIVRYLEYQGIACRKIVYSNIQNRVIHVIDCVYEMFRLINGVDQFVRTGNAKLLSECYESEASEKTRKLLQKIVEFSEIITLCDIKKVDAILPEISNSLNSYEQLATENSFFEEMFYSLIHVIREKLYLKENSKMEYPQLIRWCLDNNMIQQAITLYVEKMPKFYYDSGILNRPNKKVKTNMGETQEVALFYTELFGSMLKVEELDEFSELLKSLEIPEDKDLGMRDCMREINRLKNECRKERSQKAFDNLKRFLQAYYNGVGKREKKTSNPVFYGEPINNLPGTAQKFLNALGAQPLWKHYFVFNDAALYKKMNVGTYQKKVRALDKAKEKKERENSLTPPELYEMMKYYCALKIIRNKINHASENEAKKDEATAIRLLESDHGICMDIDFKNVKALLYKGIEAHEAG